MTHQVCPISHLLQRSRPLAVHQGEQSTSRSFGTQDHTHTLSPNTRCMPYMPTLTPKTTPMWAYMAYLWSVWDHSPELLFNLSRTESRFDPVPYGSVRFPVPKKTPPLARRQVCTGSRPCTQQPKRRNNHKVGPKATSRRLQHGHSCDTQNDETSH